MSKKIYNLGRVTGKTPELRFNNKIIETKYDDEDIWRVLADLSSLFEKEDIINDNGITAVHILPTDAKDGDLCLYSPANTIELCDSGKRIYFDWEEFTKPIDDDALTDVYYVFEEVPDGIYGIAILRVNEGESTFLIRQPLSNFQIKWVNEVFAGGGYDRLTAEGDIEYTIEYTSVDELPKYYELEKFDTILEQIVEGNVPCFYAPYRLMVYRGGEWQNVEDLLNIDGGSSVDLTDYYTKQEIDDKGFITEEDLPDGGVYVGSGDMPEDCNVQIDPDGDVVVIPTKTSELENDSGFITEAIPAVHILPIDAKDGDMCLYSPANVIEPSDSGKRIYFDWEKFTKPVSENIHWDIYDGTTPDECVLSISVDNVGGSDILTFDIWKRDNTQTDDWVELFVQFEKGEIYEAWLAEIQNGEQDHTMYSSVDEIPKYFDLPEFETLTFIATEGTTPCFYAPYRLMVYRAGEWQRVETLLDMPSNDSYIPADKIELTTETATLEPNTHYSFGEVATLTLEFAEGDSAKVNEYMFSFTSGETATVLTLPSSVQWANELTVEANKRYEISVADNIGLWCAVDLAVSE